MKRKILTAMMLAAIVVMMLSCCGNSAEPSESAEPGLRKQGITRMAA